MRATAAFGAVAAVFAPGAAFAAEAHPQAFADHVWTIVAAAMVLLMQAGFLMLEAGLSRTSSAINVAMKNLVDFVLSACLFYLIGFGLMFGASNGVFGGSLFAVGADAEPWLMTFFVFQLVFAATAATIVSGAVAERTRIYAYAVMTVVCAVVYPVGGHWAWGNLYLDGNEPWLASMGFVDFAGSTVVHSVGGWIALAAAIVVGPRAGRFGPDAREFRPNNAALSTLGAILLWFGWIGFNGGSTTSATPAFAGVVMNTMLAGAFGGLAYMTIGAVEDKAILKPEKPINGVLAGLVSVTAGCAVLEPHGAVVIGFLGGVVCWAATGLLEKLGIDDVVGAAPVHGFAGAWGTVGLAFLAPAAALPAGSALAQAQVQASGILAYFAWAFGVSFLAFKGIDAVWRRVDERAGSDGSGFRVSPEVEREGLNVEHGVQLGTAVVQRALRDMADGGEYRRPIEVEPGDENAEIAQLVDRIRRSMLEVIDSVSTQAETLSRSASDVREIADGLAGQAEATRNEASVASTTLEDARDQAEEVVSATDGVKRLSHGVSGSGDRMRANADHGSADAVEIRKMTGDMSARSEASAETVSRTATAAEVAAQEVAKMRHAAAEIGEAIGEISDVANRTHVLALNARVEAARSSSGDGFAVVADEVKRLAVKVSQAASRVSAAADGVGSTSGAAAERMREVVDSVREMDRTMRDTADLAEKCREKAVSVESGMAETRTDTGGVADAIVEIDRESSAMADKSNGAVEAARSVVERMGRVRESADRNLEMATRLRDSATSIESGISDLRRSVRT